MRDWRKLHALSWTDRSLLLQAAIALPIVSLLLRWLSVRRCQAILSKLAYPPYASVHGCSADVYAARRVARMTRIAANRSVFRTNCLHRSLVTWWLLRRQGLNGEIRYGGRRVTAGLEAHAWVEWQDSVVGDSAEVARSFAPFASGTTESAK